MLVIASVLRTDVHSVDKNAVFTALKAAFSSFKAVLRCTCQICYSVVPLTVLRFPAWASFRFPCKLQYCTQFIRKRCNKCVITGANW